MSKHCDIIQGGRCDGVTVGQVLSAGSVGPGGVAVAPLPRRALGQVLHRLELGLHNGGIVVDVQLDEPGVVDALRVSREEAGVLHQSFVPRGDDAIDR